MTLPIVFHPDYVAPLRPGHAFPMSKYGYLREALVARRLLPPAGGFVSPAPASVARVAAVHALPYVERVANQTLAPAEARAIGLPNTAAVARRSFLAAAGTLLAARLALEHGVACNMAGGSHHAGPEGGAGYCVFNDVAVAAQALLDEGVLARVLVVDCDVHQGDGTARIFAGRADVLTLSLHAERNYPARKARSHLDCPAARPPRRPRLPRGPRPRARRSSSPSAREIVFYNAGVDPHAADRLGRLALSDAGLRARDRLVAGWARRRRLPLVGVLGGGYDSEPERLAARHAILFEEAARAADGESRPWPRVSSPPTRAASSSRPTAWRSAPEDCRTIFLDWALGQPGAGPAEIAELLAHYGARQPDHPMTAILRAAASAAARRPPAAAAAAAAGRRDPTHTRCACVVHGLCIRQIA